VEFLGEGTFCEIWKVRNLWTNRLFVLKRLRLDWQDDPQACQLLENEARAGKTVRSPHVVRVDKSQTHCTRPFALIEWVEGTTLEEQFASAGSFAPSKAVWIARQVVKGLSDLMQSGYAHGDLKPANILISKHGLAKLIDLGFARRIHGWRVLPAPELLTGTAEYMAPEALSGKRHDPVAKDVYSLGVLLFQMLSGRLPFEAESTPELLRLHCEASPPDVRSCCPNIRPNLAELIASMLSKSALLRPQCLGSLLRQLVEIELSYLPVRIAA
jgi:serine/threonine-protein kinase